MSRASRGSTPRHWYLDRGRSRLHVRELGHGQTVIVVHGGPDFDHEYLLPELDLLADRLQIVYYDQRGRSRSFSGEGPADVTIESEVADLDAVLDATGAPAAVVLGHSFGVVLALEYAVRHPDRVSHLVLMNSAPVSYTGVAVLRRELAARKAPGLAARMLELAADPAFGRGEVEPEAEYYRIHFGTTLTNPEQLNTLVGRLRRAFTPEAVVAARAIETSLYAQTWDREEYDLTPRLAALPMPALVIHGARDFCPPEIAEGIAAAIPRSRLVVLEDCGHFASMEQPVAVRSLVLDFLDQWREP